MKRQASSPVQVRALDAHSPDEVALVALRMRETLVEVLGQERGESMYTLERLRERVLWHLDTERVTGAVYVAEAPDGEILGHTIVRTDRDEDGQPIGLFSTTYVHPSARRRGVASALLSRGEHWMSDQGVATAVTYTDKENRNLQALYLGHGYTLRAMPNDFVALTKALRPDSSD